MKRLFAISLVAAALYGCSCNSQQSREPIPEALHQGHIDAERALAFPTGSMDRERAILSIRAKEQELRKHGFNDAADDYAAAADSVIRNL